ncbi:MAG: hypothetical protein IPM98_00850 [Lewinellaceae bacterium]|nr:hypothetical protein [Lewinellaceae bacterium]
MNRFWSTLLAGALGGFVTFGAIKMTEQPREQPQSSSTDTLAKQVRYAYGGGGAPFDFTRAAEKTMPTVVHIKSTENRQTAIQRQRETNPFRFFFGDDFSIMTTTPGRVPARVQV